VQGDFFGGRVPSQPQPASQGRRPSRKLHFSSDPFGQDPKTRPGHRPQIMHLILVGKHPPQPGHGRGRRFGSHQSVRCFQVASFHASSRRFFTACAAQLFLLSSFQATKGFSQRAPRSCSCKLHPCPGLPHLTSSRCLPIADHPVSQGQTRLGRPAKPPSQDRWPTNREIGLGLNPLAKCLNIRSYGDNSGMHCFVCLVPDLSSNTYLGSIQGSTDRPANPSPALVEGADNPADGQPPDRPISSLQVPVPHSAAAFHGPLQP
jgi:hypothetical protein